jgi:hypothetical protein
MRLAAAVAVASVLGVSPALAQPSRTAPAAPAPYAYQPGPGYGYETTTERYGTTIALVDGASFLAIILGAMLVIGSEECIDCPDDGDDSDVALGAILMIGGVGGYYLGGPLVHNSKGNSSGAWKSLGARVLLPLAGSLIAAGSDDNDDEAASLTGVGILGAMVLDWFVFAKREVRGPSYGPYARSLSGGGGVVGLGGTF